MHHSFLIHSSVEGHLGCFHVLAIVNSPAMKNGILVSFSILVSSRYMPRSGIAGSYGGFGMWDLNSWIRDQTTVSPVLESGFLTTGPPGKSLSKYLNIILSMVIYASLSDLAGVL